MENTTFGCRMTKSHVKKLVIALAIPVYNSSLMAPLRCQTRRTLQLWKFKVQGGFRLQGVNSALCGRRVCQRPTELLEMGLELGLGAGAGAGSGSGSGAGSESV